MDNKKLFLKTAVFATLFAGTHTASAAQLQIETATDADSQTSGIPHITFRGCKGTYRTQYSVSPTQGDITTFDYDEQTYGTLKQVTLGMVSGDAWKVQNVLLDGVSQLSNATAISTEANDFGGAVQSHTVNIDLDAECSAYPYCVNVAGPWFYNRDEGEFLHTHTEKNGRPVYRRADGERWLWYSSGQWKIWQPKNNGYYWQAKWTGGGAYNPIDSHADINHCEQKTSQLFLHGGGNFQEDVKQMLKTATGTPAGEGDLAYISTAASSPVNYSGTYEPRFDQIDYIHHDQEANFDDFVARFANTVPGPGENQNQQYRAQAVYIHGGSQSRLRNAYVNTSINDQVFTPIQQFLLELKEYGIPMLGVSAGTAFMSDPTNSSSYQIRGMGAVPGVIVDQHFKARNREGRMITALSKYPDMIGLGVDENSTAIITDDYNVQVVNGAIGDCSGIEYLPQCYGLGVEVFYNGGTQSRLFAPGESFDLRDYSPYLNTTFGQ